MRTIITILDSIVATSMPYNEFVLYRAKHYKEEKQHLIICNSHNDRVDENIPDNLKIDYIGSNCLRWRKSLIKIISFYKKNKQPYVVHLHQAGPSMKLLLLMMGTGFNNKVVFTVHSTYSGYPIHNKIRSFIDGMLSRYVVCCSKCSFASYPRILKIIKQQRIVAIQNGVDISRIEETVSTVKRKPHDGVVFVFVARMVPIKNHRLILDIAHKTSPNVSFLLIGDEDKEIVRRIKEEHLEDKIVVTGLIPRPKVFEMLMNSDIYISPSTLEGLPVSVLEGMYIGLPAVLSDIPQHQEIASRCDFVNIIPTEPEEWIKTINDWAEKDRGYFLEMGAKSRDYVKSNFSLEKMHEQYDEIYNKLI